MKDMKFVKKRNVIEYGDDMDLIIVSNDIDIAENVIVLNVSAIKIWKLLEEPMSIEEIVHRVSKEYPDVSEEILENDVSETINNLHSQKLITMLGKETIELNGLS